MMHHLNLQSSTSNISSPTSVFFFGKSKFSVADVMTMMHHLNLQSLTSNPQHPTLNIQHLITHFYFLSGKSKFSVADVMTMMHHLNLQSSTSNPQHPTSHHPLLFFSGKSKFSVADVMTMMHHLNLQSSTSNPQHPILNDLVFHVTWCPQQRTILTLWYSGRKYGDQSAPHSPTPPRSAYGDSISIAASTSATATTAPHQRHGVVFFSQGK